MLHYFFVGIVRICCLLLLQRERESVLDGGGGGGVCVNDIYKWGLELLGFGN